jgi:acyl dehydratase
MTTDEQIGEELAEGKITDDAVARAREMAGIILRPEGPYLQDATADTLRNFCNGIGDLNPLYRDLEYGRRSRLGTVIGHPSFPYVYGWPGRTRWGLPGVHGFYAGNDWELFRNVRPGDRITAVERVLGVEEKESKFSGRLVIQYTDTLFVNQRDETIARVLGICTRHERKAARDSGKYADVKPYEYPDAEMDQIIEAVLTEPERIRGGEVRYYEDVSIGQDLPPIARGPLSLMDTMGFLVGCGRGYTHGVLLASVVKHPSHYFRNKEAGGAIEYTGIGHHRDSVAKNVGVPGTYDYGPQRSSWLATVVTNWMGDAGFLKRIRSELRRFNVVGDTTWAKAKVVDKVIREGHPCVDLEVWCENQRKELTGKGVATVVLPSRDPRTRAVVDGSRFELGLKMGD